MEPSAKRPRGRRAAIIGALVALAVLGALGYTQRVRIVEEWHLFRIRTGSEETRSRSIDALAAMGSPRAEPFLLERIQRRLERHRLTFTFNDRPLKKVAAFIEESTGVPVRIDPSLEKEEPVIEQFAARDMSAWEAVKQIATITGVAYRPEGQGIEFISKGK